MGSPKNLSLVGGSQKFAWGSWQNMWASVERLISRVKNEINKKVFGWNIEKWSKKLLRHPLMLKSCLYGKHFLLMCLEEKKK
jgi:hypothetical protein